MQQKFYDSFQGVMIPQYAIFNELLPEILAIEADSAIISFFTP
ncbi:hypothetical protein BN133_1914 [Cronobacter dublinensis 582]|nr:hypothetical protein BN133_1914 [Cronobacter dublinensis 582]